MSQADAETGTDEVRDRLLHAAAQVFARKGYDGTRILDIVREAGLSTGAVYGRFSSKDDLLKAAVVGRAPHAVRMSDHPGTRVADVIARASVIRSGPLTDDEAVRLEAAIAARRHPEVATALGEAQAGLREQVQPLVEAALVDGTVAPDVDPEAVLYFVRTMQMGLLAQRAAHAPAPDPAAWKALVDRLVASFGDAGAPPATHPTIEPPAPIAPGDQR